MGKALNYENNYLSLTVQGVPWDVRPLEGCLYAAKTYEADKMRMMFGVVEYVDYDGVWSVSVPMHPTKKQIYAALYGKDAHISWRSHLPLSTLENMRRSKINRGNE
jgi:hypothetical protein